MGSDYPKREKFFFCKFARAIYLLGIANEIGPDGVALLLAIASTEDSLKYIKPPNFWNSQLMNMCGFRTEGTLIRARQKLVDMRLVHYEKGSKSRAGTYWVVASPVTSDAYSNLHHENVEILTIENQSQSEVNPKLIRNQSETKALPSYPVPEPEPEPIARSSFKLTGIESKKESRKKPAQYAIPSLEEVRIYAKEIKAQSDPEGFFDHFEARKWCFKGNDRVKDWKAAYRTWERNDKKFASERLSKANGKSHQRVVPGEEILADGLPAYYLRGAERGG